MHAHLTIFASSYHHLPFLTIILCQISTLIIFMNICQASTLHQHTFKSLQFGIPPGGICEVIDCVKGTCVVQHDPPFYQCDCEAGWASPLNLSYVPCVAPDCAVYDACSKTANPPSYSLAPPLGFTIHFDVCKYPVCGHGQCRAIETDLLYKCECDPGYDNFLNISTGYCFRECELGADCGNNVGVAAGGDDPQASSASDNETISNEGATRRSWLHTEIMVMVVFSTVLVLKLSEKGSLCSGC